MSHLESIRQNEEYSQELDRANTDLTICLYGFNSCKINIINIYMFNDACDKVAQVLMKYKKTEKLLGFFIWKRNKLASMFKAKNTELAGKYLCQTDASALAQMIRSLCNKLGNGNIVPLLKEIPDTVEQHGSNSHSH